MKEEIRKGQIELCMALYNRLFWARREATIDDVLDLLTKEIESINQIMLIESAEQLIKE